MAFPTPSPLLTTKLSTNESMRADSVLEAFSFCIFNKDTKPRGVYGTIIVRVGLDFQYIYNREKDGCESIKPGMHSLLLTPAYYISGIDGPIDIEVFLIDKDSDDIVTYGHMCVNPFSRSYTPDEPFAYQLFHDRILSRVRPCSMYEGQLWMDCIMLSKMLLAKVEVKLLSSSAANFHGRITARCAQFMDYGSVLFQNECECPANENECEKKVVVCPGKLIPLSKSVVPVQLDSSLRLEAYLDDCHGDMIVHGTAEFDARLPPPEGCGVSLRVIDGKIQLKVTWEAFVY